jgi:hypothetical protein
MNILEVEDQIKGLPDQVLIQEASQPSGRMPQFLVVSELQRRNDMRKAAQKPPTRTVTENVVQEGIASLMPQPSMQAQMQPSPQGQMPMQAPMAQRPRTSPAQPMAMASGGVTKMQDGGMSPFGTGFEGQGVPNIIDMIYAQQMQAAQAQREAAEAARQQSATRSEQMQEQARRDALNQALVGIGTGIARGDMAGGFAAGAESAQGRMKEARTEAQRASERAEQLALAREEAARKGELGAFTRGAELRLGMGKEEKPTAAIQNLQMAERILADPASTESQRSWAQNIVGMRDEQSYALDRKIETLRQAYPGASEEDLRRMALGAIQPITDPVRGTTEVIDVLGEYLAAPVEPEKTPEQVATEAREIADAEREATFAMTDDDVAVVDRRLTNATGSVEQFFARGANKLSGLLGTAAFFPGVEASASALDLIRRDMARQIATDEGNRLLVTIYRDALEDMPDWSTSDSKALSLSQENIRRMDEGIANARGILASDTATAKMKSDAERAITSLQENRRRLYDLVRGTATSTPEDDIDALIRKYQ